MKYVCASCPDKKCTWIIEGEQPSSIEIQDAECRLNPEDECDWRPIYNDMEEELLRGRDFIPEDSLGNVRGL